MSPPIPPTPTPRRQSRREILDSWFPTVLRYVGVALMVYAAVIDKGSNPALIPAATGLIFFKTIYGAGNGRRD